MRRAVEHIFNGQTTPYTNYDKTKTVLGALIQQKTGANPTDIYAGPMPIGMARPMEAPTAIASGYPHVISISDTIDWVFLAETSNAAATRRIVLYEYNKVSQAFSWKGFITLSTLSAGNRTIRGMRASLERYSTGSVEVSGTGVTGTGTAWQASRLTVGSRIGFGSTNPNLITVWYEIGAIGGDGAITLTEPAGTIAAGTAYVIEDLRILLAETNATATNGGLFVVKGLRYETFSGSGTIIPAATDTDNIRATYWLADAAVVTNTISCGLAIQDKADWTTQHVYIIDGTTTTCRVYKYNVRAALTLVAGKATDAFVLKTGAQTPTGTVSQANNGRIGTLNHGPGLGVESLYFVTGTRVYRAAMTAITDGNVSWQTDAMVEVPPGGTSTYAASGVLSSVEITGSIDRLVVMSTGSAGARSYVTRYNTNSDPFDHIFLTDTKQLDQSSADSGSVVHPTINASIFSVWVEGGIAYLCRNGTTSALNQLYAVPIGAHWAYAGGTPKQRLITPALFTPQALWYGRVFVNAVRHLGSGTMGIPTEAYQVFYRTSGIDDDSGVWTELDSFGQLGHITPAQEIQFMIEFKILGLTCVPARIHSVCLTYEDTSTDSHYLPSISETDLSERRFAWVQENLWGFQIPDMIVRTYNVITGTLVLEDTVSASEYGTWEMSSDGGENWIAWNPALDAIGMYIRYTANSLPDGLLAKVILNQG